MKKILLLLGGVAIGFVAAHFVNQTAQGRSCFERVNAKTDAFISQVKSSFKEEIGS